MPPLSESVCFFQELNVKWEDQRTCNCNPLPEGRKRKYTQVELESYQKEENFAEFYNRARILPVKEFLVEQGYDVSTMGSPNDMVKFIQEDFLSFVRVQGNVWHE